jgi:ABC-type methionine transport system permease subunit
MVAQKHQSLLFAFLMALLMSGIMSLVLSLSVHQESIQNQMWHWLKDWHLSFWVAMPTTLLVTPVVKKLTALLVKPDNQTVSV